jgi:hypothetical protein
MEDCCFLADFLLPDLVVSEPKAELGPRGLSVFLT